MKLIASYDTNSNFWKNNAKEAVTSNDAEKTDFLNKNHDLVAQFCPLPRKRYQLECTAPSSSMCRRLTVAPSRWDLINLPLLACWGFTECVSDTILKRDMRIIRNAPMHSIILDSTKDRDDWVAVLAMCIVMNGQIQIVLCDLKYG